MQEEERARELPPALSGISSTGEHVSFYLAAPADRPEKCLRGRGPPSCLALMAWGPGNVFIFPSPSAPRGFLNWLLIASDFPFFQLFEYLCNSLPTLCSLYRLTECRSFFSDMNLTDWALGYKTRSQEKGLYVGIPKLG